MATSTKGSASVAQAIDESAVQKLRETFRGPLLLPSDPGYDEARQVWNGLIDRRPALIARCTGAADVIDAVNFARESGIATSVRGGGHNVSGSAVCDGGVMIDLSLMRGARVDPVTRTAWAQGGVTWGDLDRETQVFGLATPGGVVSTTGIGGLSLGGGLGWLRNKYGLSCDNIVSADVVTADGRLLTASARENPDLYWGIRGGGGNFGVVTSFQFKLHPVGPMVMMCVTAYPLADAPKVARAWRDFVSKAPDEVSAECLFWSLPDIEGFPPEARNKAAIICAAMYSGPAEEGERVLAPLRQFATPLVDMSSPMPFQVAQSMFDPFLPKRERLYYFKSTDLKSFSDETIDAAIDVAKSRPVGSILMAIWHYGGAMRRAPAGDTAFASRGTPFLFSIDAIWDEAKDTERVIAWAREKISGMQEYSSGGSYVNFAGFGEEGESQVRATYGANYEKLVALKNKYDPTNLFRMNQNIRPTA